jgi:hypothetical protein
VVFLGVCGVGGGLFVVLFCVFLLWVVGCFGWWLLWVCMRCCGLCVVYGVLCGVFVVVAFGCGVLCCCFCWGLVFVCCLFCGVVGGVVCGVLVVCVGVWVL